ncbi:MAG: hypothetical protein K8S99_02985 [Planctomycetes bacterium]|nr:hypothetical protein [Planctomycetota bacterium]
MFTLDSLEALAQDALSQEWAKLVMAHDKSAGGKPVVDGLWMLRKFLPDTMRIVEAAHDQPIESLEPEIRQHLLEGSFVDENGDASSDEPELANIDRDVTLMMRVLDTVRTEALARGYWSDAPVTPIMFG